MSAVGTRTLGDLILTYTRQDTGTSNHRSEWTICGRQVNAEQQLTLKHGLNPQSTNTHVPTAHTEPLSSQLCIALLRFPSVSIHRLTNVTYTMTQLLRNMTIMQTYYTRKAS
jgi:hypothetical protein